MANIHLRLCVLGLKNLKYIIIELLTLTKFEMSQSYFTVALHSPSTLNFAN